MYPNPFEEIIHKVIDIEDALTVAGLATERDVEQIPACDLLDTLHRVRKALDSIQEKADEIRDVVNQLEADD